MRSATGPDAFARLALAALLCAAAGTAAADPLATARAHLAEHGAELGLGRADVDALALADRRPNRRTGVEHLFFEQRIAGLDVVGSLVGIAVDAEGRVFSRWSRAVTGVAARAPARAPTLDAAQAVAAAGAALGLAPSDALRATQRGGGSERAAVFADPALSLDPIPVRLAYLAQGAGGVALVWEVVLRTPGGAHWGAVFVDAANGAQVETHDWVAYDSYRVFPRPVEHPEDGARALVVDPADAAASPFGWHDENGLAGPEYTDTRGNNVLAQDDLDANDFGGARPSSPTLDFDFALDLDQTPGNYLSAAITNLFFWNNLAHDVFWHYGFDEAAGNFQTNNYGAGGSGGDAVRADAQDGSDVNNANFGTPPDGTPPRMQMFVWNRANGPRVFVNAPAGLGPFAAGVAQFGPALDVTGTSGLVVQALDAATGTTPSTTDACSALTNPGAVAGKLAIVDRGECNFTVKVSNCQDAGAVGVVVVNNQGDALVTMSGTDPSITIPSLFVGQSDGGLLRAEPDGTVDATLQLVIERDSDLDAGVILHEYGHGVSNRLTGGPSAVFCLDENRGRSMGEGWSDFFALAMLAEAGDADVDPRAIGAYLDGDPGGIRVAPYSTDFAVNALTFEDVETLVVPHGAGTVWATALWEMYWSLVGAYGFDPELVPGSGGSRRALELVVDALSLQPCDPSFLEARDALLAADAAATGGEDMCLLWDAFARRGFGANASDPNGAGPISVSEDFSVPSACDEYCGDGATQAPEACDDGNRLDFDGCHSGCQPEDTFTLSGTAQGGSVSLTVDGVLVSTTTTAGQSADEVLEALAAEIEADPTLSSQGISAQVVDGVLTTGGTIDATTIADAGFAPPAPVPALAPAAGLLAAALLGALGARRASSRACRRSSRSSSRTCPRCARRHPLR